MNKAETDTVHELCSRIAVENDHKKFLELVEELNCILSASNKDLQNRNKYLRDSVPVHNKK